MIYLTSESLSIDSIQITRMRIYQVFSDRISIHVINYVMRKDLMN
jgi:hypothetical protein